jgi:hypothetical protein
MMDIRRNCKLGDRGQVRALKKIAGLISQLETFQSENVVSQDGEEVGSSQRMNSKNPEGQPCGNVRRREVE